MSNKSYIEFLQSIGEYPVFHSVEEKVKYERKQLHLSADYVAGYLRINPSMYIHIENGNVEGFSPYEISLLEKLFLTELKV